MEEGNGFQSIAPLGELAFGQGQAILLSGFVIANYREWDNFECFIIYSVSDGSKIHLWHDLWNGQTSLKERYPNLFLITRETEHIVADYIKFGNDQFYWNLLFISVA